MDRQTTTPFLLRLFYRQHAFHPVADFPVPSPAADGSSSSAPTAPSLPSHLQIYTWPTCTLRELGQLLTSCLPSLLPDPAVGTRLNFRLVYPDAKQAAAAASGGAPEGRGRYLSKDMGSVVVGVDNSSSSNNNDRDDGKHDSHGDDAKAGAAGRATQFQGDDADKTLQDLRFIIGDFVDCAIVPPLADGSVAPPSTSRGQRTGGMRAFGSGPYSRERDINNNSSSSSFPGRTRGTGRGAGRPGGPVGRVEVPAGGWTRGEQPMRGDGRAPNGANRRGRGRPY